MSINRKEAIREFKERVTPQGIYAIRCTQTGQCWVGAARNLDAQRNSTWFQLNAGNYRQQELQAQWKQHGEGAFVYEALEQLPDDISPIVLQETLAERRSHWAQELKAMNLK